jgi:ParB/RepB/Spo0J family partition protein
VTSGNFDLIPTASITIDRENRQRRDLKNIEELAQSIRERGLINPIVVTRDLTLVAGERRLTAHKLLGFDQIAVQYAEDLDTEELHMIELEENIKRDELDWKDHVRAVATFHKIRSDKEPEWSQNKTAEALGISSAQMSKLTLVNKMLDEEVPEVLEAPKFSTAANFAERKQERSKTAAKRDLMADLVKPDPAPTGGDDGHEIAGKPPLLTRFAAIENVDFGVWSQTVQTEPYNLIHCDFPYGVNAGDTKGQSAAKHTGGYDDKPEDYFNLIDKFIERQDNFTGPSAHLVFWFSMDFYTETKAKLEGGGWRVSPFPLIWYKSDNTGILPDSNRGPRRIYETAFFCTRGDRKVVKAVGNAIGAPTTKHYHMSEKSEVMLTHFFRMLVDESTRMLDPTCGSGMAVKVAEALGAAHSLGLERDTEFALGAKDNLDLS